MTAAVPTEDAAGGDGPGSRAFRCKNSAQLGDGWIEMVGKGRETGEGHGKEDARLSKKSLKEEGEEGHL